ncbi:gliding motility-associated C-terminal domain-containing protein [Flavobacterium sp. SUN052]|uniref:gliding motility-associated C-terminal domain-containing protein n=1 Tax=Flavobacterium sp. SUN052 TaxID=3002441 RepID=UPI00237D66D8|nr:gliding motility-associated C-terminal domain-containing protein [Flavobacterium sp. SUN052]MEC4004538.1 gliding motility-associated C-terminal domain-containing protein [Flavobacterium sp. SUN052]
MKISFSSNICLFLFLFFAQFSFSQLSNFNLVVTKTDETCSGNGTITFTTSGSSSGATIIYSIFKFPNLVTPLATLAGNTLGGLTSGNYRVIATQSLGSNSGSQQQDITIVDQVQTLSYEVDGNNSNCGIDGTITINILTGNAISYEIFSGPVTFSIQNSNVFTGLVLGSYQIRVFDNCGDGIVQSFSVFNPISGGIGIVSNNTFISSNCVDVLVTQTLTNADSYPISYPLNIEYTVFHPVTGAAIVSNQILTSGNFLFQYLPLFPNQYYTYNVKITDACGTIFQDNNNVVNSSTIPKLFINNLNCTQGSYVFIYAQSVTITSAPLNYTGVIPFNVVEGTTPGTFPLVNLPLGNYSFTVIDVCGNVNQQDYYLSPYAVQVYEVFTRVGCDVGYGSTRIKSNVLHIQSISIINAPSTYTASLPQNVSNNIDFNGFDFYMNHLPEGYYVFKLTDECGLEEEVYCYITGFQETSNISITENCGSFNINLFHTSNSLNAEYYLQKFNTVTNQWVHPVTGMPGVNGTVVDNVNAISLISNAINFNFTSNGIYRIVFHKFSYGSYETYEHCYETIYSFEYNSQPIIKSVYSFQCSNNTYDVLVDANGIGNLTYRITTKNGNLFLINNGNNPAFLGLEPATYNFQVEDSCGSILNIKYDVPTPFTFEIVPSNLCNGQTGTLIVPNFTFLEYQWWKGNNTSTILSVTNLLNLPNFNSINDAGIYHVRIRYSSNPNSCIDATINYTISPNNSIPNAGQDGVLTICGSTNSVNLFTVLNGTYDANGLWEEVSSSGMLSGNTWLPIGLPYGIYTFKYKVNGFCNSFDEAQVTINFNAAPETPIIAVDSNICAGNSIQFSVQNILNASYQWTGPNGFSSSLQNPIIVNSAIENSGIYTVKVTLNGCESSSTIAINVKPKPEFLINAVCINGSFTVTINPNQNSFVSENATYLWSGPNGFSSSTNPINITGQPIGIYSVNVTNSDGCSVSQSINIANTQCTIPKGISPNGDGLNDSFDLSGFIGIRNVKIFNRYGVLVFEQENYVNEWHGQQKHRDALLPGGTYYYLVDFENEAPRTGWVYLTID